ncbi:2-dehydropantoate 2-reductase [Mucor ambiguus]|uniref:2-dehydropantoate 2-reductase n=1 Tax=Mucor ambiguus TaxID=91626 RepID=A0A0C9LT84_9FUNG|nr:2-dehydropantoate 2-reductase [Mucor ambiguus]
MSIHILGTGAVGCHIAATLKANRNKVTLLLRSQDHLKNFRNLNNSITYRCQGKTDVVPDFDASVTTDTSDKSPIQSLVVATKTNHTLKALEPMASRLTPTSSILLMQNGMGVAEELMKSLWRDKTPPKIYVGVNRHAIERMAPYDIHHHSGYNDPDALRIGRFPTTHGNSAEQPTEEEVPEFLRAMVDIPRLQAAVLPWEEIRVKIYKKLFVNSCINGVASVLNTKNIGVIKDGNPGGIAMMRSICEEGYEVFKDEMPGESVESLMDMVMRTNLEAGENVSSTLQDIRAKRLTEVDYLNGYIVRMGQQKGINVKSNQAIVNFIHAREVLY